MNKKVTTLIKALGAKKLNGNALAKVISEREGKKKEVDIAQIKEVLGVLSEIAAIRPVEVLNILYNVGRKRLEK